MKTQVGKSVVTKEIGAYRTFFFFFIQTICYTNGTIRTVDVKPKRDKSEQNVVAGTGGTGTQKINVLCWQSHCGRFNLLIGLPGIV